MVFKARVNGWLARAGVYIHKGENQTLRRPQNMVFPAPLDFTVSDEETFEKITLLRGVADVGGGGSCSVVQERRKHLGFRGY